MGTRSGLRQAVHPSRTAQLKLQNELEKADDSRVAHGSSTEASPKAGARSGIARLVVAAVLALGLVAIFPAGALAKRHDRNHDRIPDRWERKHHLSLHVNQARRDQDRDGLRNLGEYRADTDPRDPDSDGDGVDDGAEHAGKVATFDAGTGILTIDLFAGGQISGRVTDETDVSCDSQDEGDDNQGDDNQGDDNQGDDNEGDDNTVEAHLSDQGDDPGGDESGGDEGDDGQGDDDQPGDDSCSVADLLPGAVVDEADLEVGAAGAVFTDIELE
jgi:hypothetical protein